MRPLILSLTFLFLSGPVFSAKKFFVFYGPAPLDAIVKKTQKTFRKTHKKIKIEIRSSNSQEALRQLIEGKASVAMLNRQPTAEEIKNASGVSFYRTIVGHHSVTPVVSRTLFNSGIKSLSLTDLEKIATGVITNWREVGGPDKDILFIINEDKNGSQDLFNRRVVQSTQSVKGERHVRLSSSEDVQSKIESSDSALGYLPMALTNINVRGIAIQSKKGPQYPLALQVKSGEYPLSEIYILVTNGPPQGRLKNYLDYLASPEGQKIIEEMGYVSVLHR